MAGSRSVPGGQASSSTLSLPPLSSSPNRGSEPSSQHDRPSAGIGPSSGPVERTQRSGRASYAGPSTSSMVTPFAPPRRSNAGRISWSGVVGSSQEPQDTPEASRSPARSSIESERLAIAADRHSKLRHSLPAPSLETVRSEASIGSAYSAFSDYRRTSIPGAMHFPPRPRPQRSLKAEGSLASLTAVTSYRRMSEFGGELMSKQEEEERQQEREADRQRLNLPDLVAATRKGLPTWKSARLKGGKAAFIERGSVDDDGGSDGGDEETTDVYQALNRLGPGGLPYKADVRPFQPREEDVLNIASSMGMVKQTQRPEPSHLLLGSTMNKKAKANSSVNVQQASVLGVQLSVLTRFADSIQTELSTADVVQKYIATQTSQLGCRYIDLVNEKLTDTPTYYLVHCWKMSFRSLVDTLRQHFALTRQPEDEVVIWIDFFCVNQHRPLSSAELSSIADIMRGIEKAILVIDRQGVCFQRTWVLYELWQTCQSDARDVINLAGVAGERLLVLPASWAWDDMYHSYITMDVGKSTCSNDRQRLALLNEMQKSDLTKVMGDIKDLLRAAAKFNLSRAAKMSGVNPRRYIDAASTYAMMLYQHARYIEAEDVMKGVKSVLERANHKDVLPQDEAAYMLHLAMIEREKGVFTDAQKLLVDFSLQFKDMAHPIYQAGLAVLVDTHSALKAFTKAEMLCRKCIEQREKQAGKVSMPVVHGLLQLASISAAQRLYDEAAEHALCAMKLAHQIDGPEGLDAAACYHVLALCYFHSNKQEDAGPLLERALVIRLARLGTDHPITLESKSIHSMWLVKQGRLTEAEVLMNSILRSRIRSYGPEHHDTLETMGSIADLLRRMNKVEEAQYSERRMLEVGRSLLKHTRMNRFRSLQYICNFLKTRDHLLDKAAMFIAKAYIVYKERLGSEAEMTLETKQQLIDIIANANFLGLQALHNADFFQKTEEYSVAEEYLKQAWSLSKLIKPEEDHADMAQCLADALFAQEKAGEAKNVMRAAGLAKKGMKQNMPTSYLRWLNKRVAKYLEKRGEQGEGLAP